jgi:hypothetical protein
VVKTRRGISTVASRYQETDGASDALLYLPLLTTARRDNLASGGQQLKEVLRLESKEGVATL